MGSVRWPFRRILRGTGLVGALAGLAILAAPSAAAAPAPEGSPPASPPSCQPTVPGDSFESPVVAPGTFTEPGAGAVIGPWTVTAVNVNLNGAGLYQAADGVQTLDLSGNAPGGVRRAVPTVALPLPLFTYVVTYCLAGNPDGGPAVKTGVVQVNGTPVQRFSFDGTGKSRRDMGYQPQRVSFTATGASTDLEFRSTTPTPYGPVIDKVAIQKCFLRLFCAPI